MNSWRPGPPEASYMHFKPYGAPVKEEGHPFGDVVKTDPDGSDVKYMPPIGGQVKQEADIKPPMLREDGGRSAFADQSQGCKRRCDPPFKDEDPSIPKRSRFEEVRSVAQPQDDFNQSSIALDTYNCDLSLIIDDSRLSASPIRGPCFAYMWHGVRATHGFTRGRICFEVTLDQDIPLKVDVVERHPHVLRVGWSINECGYTLGEEPLSWGYGGTGKASTNLKFKDYGCQFKTGDVVGAYLDLDLEPAVMSFTVNGNHQGIAYELRKFELKGRPIFPHVLTKNIRFSVNFGDSPQPKAPLLQGYTLVGKVPPAMRVQGSLAPASKNDCEALMMIGLPGCGKTTWVQKYTNANRHKQYNVLGSNDLLEKMKVDGLARKRNYSGRWDVLISACMQGLSNLLQMAYKTPRNYIIDQTNVYRSARKRKMKGFSVFRRRAIVICPSDRDLKARTAKREREEGKDIPDEALMEMKANFSLPEKMEPFDSIEYIELCEKEASVLVVQYNEEAAAIKGTSAKTGGFRGGRGGRGGRGWNRQGSPDSFNPSHTGLKTGDIIRAGRAFYRKGSPDPYDAVVALVAGGFNSMDRAPNRGRGIEGFARGGRGSSSFDRGGGSGRGGAPDSFNRGGGSDDFGRGRGSGNFGRGGGSDRPTRGGGPGSFTRGDGGDSNPNDFTQRGRGGFNNDGKQGGFNQNITQSSASHDAPDDFSGNGPDRFNRGGGSGIVGFDRGRGFNNSSRGQVSNRFGIGGATEDNNRSIPTDHYSRGGGSDILGRGSVSDRFSSGGVADTYGRGGGPETYERDGAPAGGSDKYGRGDSDTYGRGGGSNPYSQGGGSNSSGHGGASESYNRGGGSDSYGRGDVSDTYNRGGGSDSYGRGGVSDTYNRGGGSDSYGRGGVSDSYGRGGGSDSYGRGGVSDTYNRGGGSDSYGRGGSDSLSGATTRFARDGDAAGGNRAVDISPYGRSGSSDCLAAGTSRESNKNEYNPVGYPYNRDSQSSGFSQDRSAGLGDENDRESSTFNRGGYGNYNRAGGYGNAANEDKYSQSSEYRAPGAPSSSWEARAPPTALGRGDAPPWNVSPPSFSAPVSRDWSTAPSYPPPAPQQQVWSSQPQGYGGYQP